MRSRVLTVPVVLALAAALAAPASARIAPSVTLDRTVVSAHATVHFRDADFASPAAALTWAQAVAAQAENGRAHLVAGGGGTPNAGLRVPVSDGDGRTDWYAATPASDPGATALGITMWEPQAATGSSAYVFLQPSLDLGSLAYVVPHEFTHVVQFAYSEGYGMLFMEGMANWGEDFAVAGIDPPAQNFGHTATGPAPWTPLACSYGAYTGYAGESRDCSGGYWHWLFLDRLVERFGPSVIAGYLERFLAGCNSGVICSADHDLGLLDDELAVHGATLAEAFRSYARDVWVPERWATPAVATFNADGPPAASVVSGEQPGAGPSTEEVDGLATRYLRIRTAGAIAPTGPDDVVRVTLTRPPGVGAAGVLVRARGGAWGDGPVFDAAAGVAQPRDLVFDAARVREIVVPLTNDSRTDDLMFTWRVDVLRGAPAPPANDTQAGAQGVGLGERASTDTVYAGGTGASELPGCTFAAGATGGVWFRFTTPASGVYRYDAGASGFGTVVGLRLAADGAFGGCSISGAFSAVQSAGRTYDVYVGRRAAAADDAGTVATLQVTGPAARSAQQTPETPAVPAARLRIAPVSGQRLASALRRGLRVRCTATVLGRCRASAWVTARTARTLGLKVPRGATSVRVALGADAAARAPGARTVTLRFTTVARRRLARARRVALTLRAALQTGGADAAASARLTLKR